MVDLSRKSSKTIFLRHPMFKSRAFWVSITAIFLVAVADRVLETSGILTDQSPLFFEPLILFWIPIIVTTSDFGVAGALSTTLWVVIVNLLNWMVRPEPIAHYVEIATILLIGLTAFILGVQVDQKKAAQQRAKTYAGFATRRQEEVLRRLSLDIHDESLQTLMAARHRLDIMQNGAKPNRELEEVKNNIEKVVKELRDIIKNLRPTILEDLGMVSAIRQLAAEMAARSGVVSKIEVTGEENQLDSGVEIQLYRIVQEALRNVERHSSAKNVAISIMFLKKEIRLEIEDDGIGLDMSKLRKDYGKDGHYGILGMNERAEMVHGRIEIKSRPGLGTSFTARIPFQPIPMERAART
jgi:signal transduction histidine kinase